PLPRAAEVAPAVRDLVARQRAAVGPAAEKRPDTSSTAAVPVRGVVRSGPPAALGVRVTPDDGHRLSSERVWDDADRPAGPAPDPEGSYTTEQRAGGRHLVDVHDHLRGELDEVRRLVEQVLDGATAPGIARSHINAMTMRQNDWTLGAYCASYCRVVTTHHTIEDQHLFPALRQGDSRLAAVIDRLEHEHQVIHEVLERVDRALVRYVQDADGGAALRAAMDVLTDALLSHLSYEEHELVEPLARLELLT
ncbi:MAG TPA: hemerythrin domain-containing protein, partial [Kineosporiaceae bacterium]|nr:hemerythrin domain-containing protein [Kineosporiaceae bacterium]